PTPSSTLFPYTTLFRSHPDAVKMLIDRGAPVNVRSKIVPSEGRSGGSSNSSVTSLPRDPTPGEKPKKDYYGGFTPLHFAVRQGRSEEHTSELQSLAYLV